MKLNFVLFVVLLSNFSFGQNKDCEQVFNLPGKNSVLLNPVFYCTENIKNFYYYSTIKTPVCSDTLCQVLQLNVFWDLAGNFVKFDTLPGASLTKHDHLPFSSVDYDKLYKILMDKNSILGYIKEERLIDNSMKKYSEKIDAMTGATAKEVKSAVVDGAPYTTYTLWNLVNRDIVQKIKNYTKSISNSIIQRQLLNSSNPKTIIFGLKMFTEKDYYNYSELIFFVMESGKPFVNFYIAKNLPERFLCIEKNKNSLKSIWKHLDRNTKSILIK